MELLTDKEDVKCPAVRGGHSSKNGQIYANIFMVADED